MGGIGALMLQAPHLQENGEAIEASPTARRFRAAACHRMSHGLSKPEQADKKCTEAKGASEKTVEGLLGFCMSQARSRPA